MNISKAEERLRLSQVFVVPHANIIVCGICEGGTESDEENFIRHMRREHHWNTADARELFQCAMEKIIAVETNRELEELYKEKDSTKRNFRLLPKLPGLPVTKVVKCMHYNHVCKGHRTLARHIRESRDHDEIDGEVDISEVPFINGQSLWRGTKAKFYFAIEDKHLEHGNEGNGSDSSRSNLIAALEHVRDSANRLKTHQPKMKGVDVRYLHTFAALTRLDVYLNNFGITWEHAVLLTAGPGRGNGEVGDRGEITKFAEEIRHCFQNICRLSRMHASQPNMRRNDILHAVSAPGTTSKKVLQYCPESTEERYARHGVRLVLMTFRLCRLLDFERFPGFNFELSRSVLKMPKEFFDTLKSTRPRESSAESQLENVDGAVCSGRNDLHPDSAHKLLHTGSLEQSDGRLRALFNLITAILYERNTLESQIAPNVANVFVACLGVFRKKSEQPRLAEGRVISPVLAGLANIAGCCGIFSIDLWHGKGGKQKAFELVMQRHSPNAGLGINVFQEMLAKTKITRSAENARELWVPCSEPTHMNCGWASGIHISAEEVGITIRKMQEDICGLIFGSDGIFGGEKFPATLEAELLSLRDDVTERKVGYCFLCHPGNESFVVGCRGFVNKASISISKLSSTQRNLKFRKILRHIENVARLLTTVLYLSSGNPPRGSEIGLHLVRNSQLAPRNFMLFNERVTCIPGYEKTRVMRGGRRRMVSRHPDITTSNLFKIFVALLMEFRAAIRLQHEPEKSAGCDTQNAVEMNFILDSDFDRRNTSEIIGNVLQKCGLSVRMWDYRQWIGGYCNDKALKNTAMKYAVEDEIGADAIDRDEDGDVVQNIGLVMQIQAGHSRATAEGHYGKAMTGISIARPGTLPAHIDQRSISLYLASADVWIVDCKIVEKKSFSELLRKREWSGYATDRTKNGGLLPKKRNHGIHDSRALSDGRYGADCSHWNDLHHEQSKRRREGQKGNSKATQVEQKQISEYGERAPERRRVMHDRRLGADCSRIDNLQHNQIGRRGYCFQKRSAEYVVLESITPEKRSQPVDLEDGADCSGRNDLHIEQKQRPNEMDKNSMKVYPVAEIGDLDEHSENNVILSTSTEAFPEHGQSSSLTLTEESQKLKRALCLGTGIENAEFKSSYQKEGMKAVMNAKQDILFVDRTGGGKSAIIFGPSLVENGVTIYLSPMKSLKEDLKQRCKKIDVLATNLDEIATRCDIPRNGIVLVSPEEVGTDEYRDIVGRLYSLKVLKRFVVDEVHIVVMSEHYRDCMAKMRRFRPEAMKVPMVMITATAPLEMTKDILISVGCVDGHVKTIRGNLRRGNISLDVQYLSDGSEECLLLAVVRSVITEIRGLGEKKAGKHLISVLTRADAENIAFLISREVRSPDNAVDHFVNVRTYHSGMREGDKEESAKEWRQAPVDGSESFVMVAKDGFATGIDSPNVKSVHIAGFARSLIDLCQIIGRVGRDGSAGKARVLFHPAHMKRAGICGESAVQRVMGFAGWACNTEMCRMVAIEGYLGSASGREWCCERKSSSGTAVELCDVCMKVVFPCEEEKIMTPPIDFNGNEGMVMESKRALTRKPAAAWLRQWPVRNKFRSASDGRYNRSVTATEILNEIDEIREKARDLGKHCALCLIKTGRGDKSTKHGGVLCKEVKQTYWDRCLRCLGNGHEAKNCHVLVRPTRGNGRLGCTECFLNTVRGERIHYGNGSPKYGRNEFSSRELCPFQEVTRLAVGCWQDRKIRRAMVNSGRFSDLEESTGLEAFTRWLTKNKATIEPGIVRFIKYAYQEFQI